MDKILQTGGGKCLMWNGTFGIQREQGYMVQNQGSDSCRRAVLWVLHPRLWAGMDGKGEQHIAITKTFQTNDEA